MKFRALVFLRLSILLPPSAAADTKAPKVTKKYYTDKELN